MLSIVEIKDASSCFIGGKNSSRRNRALYQRIFLGQGCSENRFIYSRWRMSMTMRPAKMVQFKASNSKMRGEDDGPSSSIIFTSVPFILGVIIKQSVIAQR